MDTIQELGKCIQSIRKAEGLTQDQLAERLGLKKLTVTFYEGGRSNLTFETIKKIANALGYDVNITFTKKNN